jgi:type I restriction enzyme S subunit
MPRTSSADLRRLTVEVPPVEVQRRIVDLMEVVDAHIRNLGSEHTALTATVRELRESFIAFMQGNADWVEFSSVTEDVRRPLAVEEQASYSQIGIRSHGRGVFGKEAVTGKTLGTKKMLTVRSGDLVFNIVFAWEGAVAVVPAEFDGWASSHRFPTFRRIDGGSEEFLRQFFLSGWGLNELLLASPGGAGRNRTLGRSALGRIRVPQVPRAQEVLFVEAITAVEALVEGVGHERDSLVAFRARLLQSLLDRGLEIAEAYDVLIDEGVSA